MLPGFYFYIMWLFIYSRLVIIIEYGNYASMLVLYNGQLNLLRDKKKAVYNKATASQHSLTAGQQQPF